VTLAVGIAGGISSGMTQQIYALAMPPKTDTPDIETIVARVKQPAPLRSALETWREVQRHYSDLAAELRKAIAELQIAGGDGAANAGPLTKRIAELDRRLRDLGQTVQKALADVLATRPPYTAAVAAALAPYRRQCAQRALTAAAALASELDLLSRTDDEIAAVGGAPGARPLPMHRVALRPTLARLRKIAE
jgi:hypothetical protein